MCLETILLFILSYSFLYFTHIMFVHKVYLDGTFIHSVTAQVFIVLFMLSDSRISPDSQTTNSIPPPSSGGVFYRDWSKDHLHTLLPSWNPGRAPSRKVRLPCSYPRDVQDSRPVTPRSLYSLWPPSTPGCPSSCLVPHGDVSLKWNLLFSLYRPKIHLWTVIGWRQNFSSEGCILYNNPPSLPFSLWLILR